MTPNQSLRTVLLWILLSVVVVTTVLLQRARSEDSATLASDEGGLVEERGRESASPDVEAAGPRVAPVTTESQLAAKLAISLHRMAPSMSTEQILGQADALRQGAFADRLGYSVLVGSVDGWDKGIENARGLALPEGAVDEARALRDGVISAMELRRELTASGDAVGEGARQVAEPLRPTMKFFVDVLGPDSAAKAAPTVVTLIAAGVWYLVAILGGLIALVIVLVVVRPAPRFSLPAEPNASVVLGETFLVWITVFLALNILSVGVLAPVLAPLGNAFVLAVSVGTMFASLAALAYPSVRGVHWRELRALVGLHSGRGLGAEIANGFLCYICSVPLLVIGLVVFFVLGLVAKAVGGPAPAPSHPVVEVLGQASMIETLLLYVLASVAAPIVEEIMFRGFLYGHLRGLVRPRVRVASFLVAALVSSTIFAAIHPQGLLFAPALGGLAVGFCIFRELRGSLIAPIVAHGVNNAVTLTLALTLMS